MVICPDCKGKGKIRTTLPTKPMSVSCTRCKGKGRIEHTQKPKNELLSDLKKKFFR